MTPSRDNFESASDTILLKILAEAEVYQPLSVEIAKDVLLTRGYSESSISEAVTAIHNKKQAAAENVARHISKVTDPIAKMLEPHNEVTKTKLIRSLQWYVGFVLLFSIFSFARECWFLFRNSFWFDTTLLFMASPMLINALLFVLVMKRNKWGWILILFSSSFSFIMAIRSMFISSESIFNPRPNAWIENGFALIVSSSLIGLLLQPDLLYYFNQSKRTGKIIVAIGAGLALALILIQWISVARIAPF